MTISAVRTRKCDRPGGFTLLEVMVAIGLIGLLMTMAFVIYNPDSSGQALQKASVELEALSARGHTMAILHQKPFWMTFERGRVVLRGASLDEVSLATPEEEYLMGQEAGQEPVVHANTEEYGDFSPSDPELAIFVRRWGAKQNEWVRQEMPEDPPVLWHFESSGLCEPISIRLELKGSWMEFEMDPLTGRIADERSEFND